MSEREEVRARLETRATEADAMIAALRRQVAEVSKAKLARAKEFLMADNARLADQVETLKSQLIQVEIDNGLMQIYVPVKQQKSMAIEATKKHGVVIQHQVSQQTAIVGSLKSIQQASATNVDQRKSPPSKQGKSAAAVKESKKAASEEEEVINVGRLDLRVGLILSAKKHPDADSLYVEEVDVGEENCRIVVSGLVRFIPLADMQNRLAVFLCNLKPAKMRGVVSEAMVMCASTPDNVEVLRPPAGCRPGQRVVCEGFTAMQPDKELNPKKKIFERIAPDLKTNGDRVATYKGVPWMVDDLPGQIVADTLANVNIK